MPNLDKMSFNVENTTSDTTGKDITDEVELNEEDVKIFKVRELAPSGAPITIPYLEVYRTNELEYVPYMSPYNVGASSSDSSDSGDSSNNTDSDSSTDSESGSTDNDNSSDNSDENSDSNSN